MTDEELIEHMERMLAFCQQKQKDAIQRSRSGESVSSRLLPSEPRAQKLLRKSLEWTNLQPLFAEENLSKGSKWEIQQEVA